jgi:hypothetical protein
MGIKTTTGGAGAIFYKINAKEGCLTHKGEDGVTVKYEAGRTTLEGMLIGAKIEENEYEGVKNETVRLIFKDLEEGAPNMHVTFGMTRDGAPSAFAMKALAKLSQVNLSQPVSLAPYLITKGTKLGETVFDNDVPGLTVKQNGEKFKEVFPMGIDKLPEAPPVMVNGKEFKVGGVVQKDKTAWVPILEAQLEQFFGLFPQQAQGQAQGEESVSVEDAAAGAATADRAQMRNRA